MLIFFFMLLNQTLCPLFRQQYQTCLYCFIYSYCSCSHCIIFGTSSLLLFLFDLYTYSYSFSNYCYLSQGFILFFALRGNSDKICIYFSLSPLRKRQGISIKQKIDINIALLEINNLFEESKLFKTESLAFEYID